MVAFENRKLEAVSIINNRTSVWRCSAPSTPPGAGGPAQLILPDTIQAFTKPGEIGIAVDGTILFNNQADPPDTLAVEASSLDTNTGHPTGGGIYHYHVEMAQIVSSGDELIGIALDGFPIYGSTEQDGSAAGFTGSASTEATENWHSHALNEFSADTYHYHIVTGYTETDDSGTPVDLLYMIGSNMAGTVGSFTQ